MQTRATSISDRCPSAAVSADTAVDTLPCDMITAADGTTEAGASTLPVQVDGRPQGGHGGAAEQEVAPPSLGLATRLSAMDIIRCLAFLGLRDLSAVILASTHLTELCRHDLLWRVRPCVEENEPVISSGVSKVLSADPCHLLTMAK